MDFDSSLPVVRSSRNGTDAKTVRPYREVSSGAEIYLKDSNRYTGRL